VFLRQGDKTGAVVIDATLMDNGAPVSLSDLTPMFKANTADGQAVIIDSTGFNIIDASGGEFTYQVPNALSAVPGKIVTAYFSFSDASGSESTFDVAFIIKKAVDATQAQADDYITIIDSTIQSLQQKIDAMNTDVQTILNAFNQGDFYNKSQTDEKDSATLSSAKTYTDSGDSATLTSAKAYADTQDATVLTSAKTYADSAIQDTGWITDGIVYANGFIKDATDPFAYRIVKYGENGLINVYLSGNAKKESGRLGLVNHQAVIAATFPTIVANYVNGPNGYAKYVIGRYTLNWSGITIRQDFDVNGSLKVQSCGANADDSFYIDSCYIVDNQPIN